MIPYFAYGSNMNPVVLSGRRGVKPSESTPGIIMDYCLSFRLRGLPFIEPGFATLERVSGKRVHGVVHMIREDEWERVKVSEGVNRQEKGYGYYEARLPCFLYGRKELEVVTLLSNPASHHPKSKKSEALISNGRFTDFCSQQIMNASFPSRRYKTLLVDGARHHELDNAYQSWLEQLTAYEDSLERRNGNRTLGSVASLSLGAGLIAPAVALGSLLDLGGQGSASNTSRLISVASNMLWDINELLVEPLVGLRGR